MIDLLKERTNELVDLCGDNEQQMKMVLEGLDWLKKVLELASGVAPEVVEVGNEVIDVVKEVVELVDAVV